MKYIKRLFTCVLICSLCLLLAGCPPYIDPDTIRTGEYYLRAIEIPLHSGYEIKFSRENTPAISIAYKSNNGDSKTAVFLLNGYDAEKRIGYKLVTKDNKAQWEQEKNSGNLEVPDLNDYELIQNAAIQYEYPVFFIKIYDYQNQIDEDKFRKSRNDFFTDLYALLGTQRMVQWLEQGLYNGDWIKAGLEETMKTLDLIFSHTDLPVVGIHYGNNKEAVFSLDGYDAKKQVGYKFVTDEDAANWRTERERGNKTAPDLADSAQIKEAALRYKFPVIYIYFPEYWKSDISEIYNNELSHLFLYDSYMYKWIEKHK